MSFEDIDLQWFAKAEDEGRTEDPTDLRIKKARDEGRVAKSQELNSAIVLLCSVLLIIVMAPWILQRLRYAFIFFFTHATDNSVSYKTYALVFAMFFLQIVMPVVLVAATAGVITNIVQNKGFIFSLKPITPQFSKVLPHISQYLQKTLFSVEGGFNVLKSLMKVGVISLIAYVLIKKDIPVVLLMLKSGTLEGCIKVVCSFAVQILLWTVLVFIVISIPDYVVQKKQFMESLKMSKQEVKQEYKEMEGDPEVKGKLEQAQRQMVSKNLPQAVKKSDVVIANPTHFAVALQYDQAVSYAPKVMAKGEDSLALRIRRLAEENDVPIVENKALARGLYTETKIGDIIPESYMQIIATIYAKVVYLNKKM